MTHEDTNAETRSVRAAILRRLSPEERVDIALQMSIDVRAIARSGIAERNPHGSESEHDLELLRILYGDALVGAAFAKIPSSQG